MPLAYIQEFGVADGDRSTVNYDHVFEELNLEADPPPGLIFHSAGFDEQRGVFRTVDIWETAEQAGKFLTERLGPILARGPVDPEHVDPPESVYFYALHNVVPSKSNS